MPHEQYTACDKCGATPLPPRRRKYCSDKCSNAAMMQRYRARKRGKEADAAKPAKSVNQPNDQRPDRGEAYFALKSGGYFEELAAERMTQSEVAEEIGFTQPSVSKAMTAWKEDVQTTRKARGWEAGTKKLGPAPKFPTGIRTPKDRAAVDQLVAHFVEFRLMYFLDPVKGEPVRTFQHQKEWLRDLLESMCVGGKKLILSPPRHGKTELLSHICVWLVTCVNPNIRIMMIGGNQAIAKNLVGVVKDHLEDNEGIRGDWLRPGADFKPGRRSGKSWTAEEFTVDTRTIAGIKSPTMVALGRGGKILSRDADLILVDDIDDDESTHTFSSREKTRNWWGITVMSRKESHTAVFIIGSRQHPDDIYSHLMEDPGYSVTVEQAHDSGDCKVDPISDTASIWECGCEEGMANLHDDDCNFELHQDCVLWPEFRSMQWLAEKHNGAESAHTFPMVYLNEPVDDEVVTFSRETVDKTKDKRRIGLEHLPRENIRTGEERRYRYIAGLDPSGTGYQAVFLWAFDAAANELFAVDLENRLGGGIRRAREQIETWHEKYGVYHWAIETNLYHGELVGDQLLRDYVATNGLNIHPVRTGKNKNDLQIGVSKLADYMEDGRLHMPWGDAEAKAKFHAYAKQLVNYSKDAQAKNSRSGALSDLLMASWFPLEVLMRWRRSYLADRHENRRSHNAAAYPFKPLSYSFAA